MMRWSVPFLALALAVPAGAQQWQVDREQFAFAGRQLTVHVEAEAEGTLRVIRGPAGLVRITGRSDGGLTAAGLTADEHLTLTDAGPGPVDFVITVPERVRVHIQFPDRPIIESMGGHDRARTFTWGAAAPQAETVSMAPVTQTELYNASAYTVFVDALAPNVVSLPDLRYIRNVTVRVEGSTFRVGASRPMALYPGDPYRMEIRPAGPPMEIILVVPAGTETFTLQAGGATALILNGEQLTVLCAPNTRQWLPGGRGWVTFTPVGDSLECEGTTAPGTRHST